MKRCLKRRLRSSIHDGDVPVKKPKCIEKLPEKMSSNIRREKKVLDVSLYTITRRKSNGFSTDTDYDDRISKSDNDSPSETLSMVIKDTSFRDYTSFLRVLNQPPVSNEPEKWKFVSLDFHKYLLPKDDSTIHTHPKIHNYSSGGININRKKRKIIPQPNIPVINDPYSDSWIDHEKDSGLVSHSHEKIALLTQIGVGRPVFPLIHRNIVTICGRRNHTEITSTWAEFALSTLVTDSDKPNAKLILLPIVDSELTQAVEDFNRTCFKNLTEIEIMKGSAEGAPTRIKRVVLESKTDEKDNFRFQSPRTDVGSLLVSDLACQDIRRSTITDSICVERIPYCSVEDNSSEFAEENIRSTFMSSIVKLENLVERSIKGKLDSQMENNSALKQYLENPTDSNVGKKISSHYENNGMPALVEDDPASQSCNYKHSNLGGVSEESGPVFISVDMRGVLLPYMGTGTGKWHRCRWTTCGRMYGEQNIEHPLFDSPSLVEHTTNPLLREEVDDHSDNGLVTDMCIKQDIICHPVGTSVSRLLMEVPCDSRAVEKVDNQFTYSAMSRTFEEDKPDWSMKEQINQLLTSNSLVDEIRDGNVEDQKNRQVADGPISRSLDENTNNFSIGSTESNSVSKSSVVDFTRGQIDHQIESILVLNSPVYDPRKNVIDCASGSNSVMSYLVDRFKGVSESSCAENSSLHELAEQLDHQLKSSSVTNYLPVEQEDDSIDFQPKNVHSLVDESAREQTDCHFKSSSKGEQISFQPERNPVMNSLIDEPTRRQIDSETGSSPAMNSLVDELTGEQTAHQFESSSVNETTGDSFGSQSEYSPVIKSVMTSGPTREPVGLKSELSPVRKDEPTREQTIDRISKYFPKSMSSVDVCRRAIIGALTNHQFWCSPESRSSSESIISTYTGDISDVELENNPALMSLLEAFGDSDELDEGASDESSDESLGSEIMILESAHPEYVRFYETVGGVKRIIDNVEIKSDIKNLSVTNSSLELVEDSPDEKWVPKLSLPQYVGNCEQRSPTDEKQFEQKIVNEPTIRCIAKKRTVRRSKVAPVSSSKRPLRNRRLIREKIVSDEWYYGNNVISSLKALRNLNASREPKRPQIDWNEVAWQRGFKRCWVVVRRVEAMDCRNYEDDLSSSSYDERRVHETKLYGFNELAQGKLSDELHRMKVRRSSANRELKNSPMEALQHDEAEESLGDHVFGCQHCTRTYGQYLDYVSRNRSFLYAYKMRRSLKFQKINNKYFRSSRYCRIEMDDVDLSFVDVETEYTDVNGDTNNSSANPLEMIPMPRGNTFGASVIKELTSENELPIHFVESTSLKRGVNYNWLILNIANDIDHVVVGGEHVLSAKLLFEVMYRADLTKKLVCNEIGEEGCDQMLKFGVYGIPSICNIVLVGPYPLSQRFPVVQVALTADIGSNVSVKRQPPVDLYHEGDLETVSAFWWKPNNYDSLNPRVSYLNFLFGPSMPLKLEGCREMISIKNLMIDHEAKTYVSYHTRTKESNFLLLHDLLDSNLVERKKLAEKQRVSAVERESTCSGSQYEDSDSSYSVACKRVDTITNADTKKGKKIHRDSKKHLTIERERRKQFCLFRDNLRSILDDSGELDSLISILNKATITIRSFKTQERNLVRQKVKLRRSRRNLDNKRMALLKGFCSDSKLTALKKRFMPDFTVPRCAEDIGKAFMKLEDAEVSESLIPDSSFSSNSVASFQPVIVSTKSVSLEKAADEGPIINSVRSLANSSQHRSRKYAAFFDGTSVLRSAHIKNFISPAVACQSAIEESINAEGPFVPSILRKRAPLNSFKGSGKSVSLVMVSSRPSAMPRTHVDDCISSAKSSSSGWECNCTRKTTSGPLGHKSRSKRMIVKPINVSSETLIYNPSFVVKSEPCKTVLNDATSFNVSTDAPVIIQRKRSKRPKVARGIRQQLPLRQSLRKKKKNRRFYESPERDDVKCNKEPLPLVVSGAVEDNLTDNSAGSCDILR